MQKGLYYNFIYYFRKRRKKKKNRTERQMECNSHKMKQSNKSFLFPNT